MLFQKLKQICNGNIILFRDTHKYFNQIQLGMYLLNVKQCHFIVYVLRPEQKSRVFWILDVKEAVN